MSTGHGGTGGAIVNVSSAASPPRLAGRVRRLRRHQGRRRHLHRRPGPRGRRPRAIRVNAVRPGIIDTGIHATGGQPDRVARLGPAIPMQRAGEADEVAARDRAGSLSDDASYCTGAILDVSGGR